MSAAAHLAGMYKVDKENEWLKGLPWDPVPIHTVPKELDPFLAIHAPCAKSEKLIEEQKKSKFFKDIVKENADLFKYLSEKTGWRSVNDVHYIRMLHSIMYTYSEYNDTFIPDWYKNLNHTLINYLAGLDYARSTFTPELKKLVAGPLIDLLMNHFEKVVANKVAPKLLMLSAHDKTLVTFLHAVELFDFDQPHFATTIIWEVYRRPEGNGHYIKMIYTQNGLRTLVLKECEEKCDFFTYRKILGVSRIGRDEWEEECST